jgi:CO/xanthine dehydrogenase Mo-binding subunit
VASVHAKYGYPYGIRDRFVAKVSVNDAGAFLVESDIPDSGTGIVGGVTRLVADYLELDQIPGYRINQAIVDDPSGSLFSRGRRPSRMLAFLYRRIERIQTVQSGRVIAALAGMGASRLARLMLVTAWPMNLFNGSINWMKSRLFPFSLDSFIPRTSSSRGMLMAGRAALDAADQLKRAALAIGARGLSTPIEDLRIGAGGVFHGSDPSRRITWAELATESGGTLAALGEAHLPSGRLLDPATGNQVGPVDYAYASHGCDVAVHPQTGEVRILRYVASHDVGRALDPETIRGQVLGGITMGVGQALLEHIVVEHGSVKTSGLHDYLVPTSMDAPADVEIDLLESGSGLGPYGAKGVGEPAAVAAPITIAHALFDALGVQIETIPATPEDIVKAAGRISS